ncbi:ANTAR domain-containing protein [Pseudonocardia sediminis]|nr:ANTAR domain-containing protein [Pseudonocardia sediminis]
MIEGDSMDDHDDRLRLGLREILDNAVRDVPGADGAVVTVLRDDAVTTGRPRLERLVGGWACDEGPCVDAMLARRTTTILLDDVETEAAERWPDYAGTAGRSGVRSVLSFVMAPPGAAPAAVSFHAGRSGVLGDPSRTVGMVFVLQAAVALYGGQQVGRLIEILGTRDVIGQATGILMERFGLDDEQAYAMLVSSAQDTDTSLLDIATWLTGQGKPPLS